MNNSFDRNSIFPYSRENFKNFKSTISINISRPLLSTWTKVLFPWYEENSFLPRRSLSCSQRRDKDWCGLITAQNDWNWRKQKRRENLFTLFSSRATNFSSSNEVDAVNFTQEIHFLLSSLFSSPGLPAGSISAFQGWRLRRRHLENWQAAGAFSFSRGRGEPSRYRAGWAILISWKVHGRVTNRDTGSNPF